MCTRIQKNIQCLNGFEAQWGKLDTVTMSFGVACMVPASDNNYENLIISADIALYKAKNEGRNRIISA